jgi:hypothetical protein
MFNGVRSVMVFAADPVASARWWAGQLDVEVHVDSLFAWIEVCGVELGFHPADDQRSAARFGLGCDWLECCPVRAGDRLGCDWLGCCPAWVAVRLGLLSGLGC